VDLDTAERVTDYLTDKVEQYMAMREYRAASDLARYFDAIEGTLGGHFPVGLNRLWHGGIHFVTGRAAPVHAMANGRIVAARIKNKTPKDLGIDKPLPYSSSFVLIRHEIHHQNKGDEILYARGSTATI
jgi:hypothetical protein